MKSKRHTKLAVLVSAIVFVEAVLTACAAVSGNIEPRNGNIQPHSHKLMDLVQSEGELVFYIENMMEFDRIESMWSVTLFSDGTAIIENAAVVSFMLPRSPDTVFTIEEDELTIRTQITAKIREMYNLDNNALELLYALPTLISDEGTRFVYNVDSTDGFKLLLNDAVK